MRTVSQRVSHASRMIGNRNYSGWCEKFVRECFGFPARYASATLAWNATKKRHSNINNAPAGVPIFWELHPANRNHGLGHVAISVGGGYCISTSVGPGGAIGKVRISDLTRSWGMTVRGWTEDYHGKTIYTPPKPSKPSPGRHVISDAKIRDRLRAAGYAYPGDGLLSTWVRNYQLAQLYKPGLRADGVWGPATEAHYNWTRNTLQRTMEGWKGEKFKPRRDGDHRSVTRARVGEIQSRNHPSNGGRLYKGALDSIPGPVFCGMLGISTHPGL